jgi:hypothetical protein
MNKYLKFVISGLLLALAIFLMSNRQIGWGIVTIFVAALPIVLFYKNEYILLAFWQLRKQNMPKAAVHLAKITQPDTQLHKSQLGYFYYLQGISTAQTQPNLLDGLMRKALEHGLNMKHDRALANLNLAATSLSKGKKQEAIKHLEEAKRLDTTNMLTEHIKTISSQMQGPSMQKHVHNPHMRHRGKF